MSKKNILVLISGSGSNLQALIDAQNQADFLGEIVAVISNKKNVLGLQRAAAANIPALILQHTDYSSREAFDTALAKTIQAYDPDLIILAGFMRILTAGFVENFRGKLLNIHPSLLPKYPGLHTHKRALKNNDEYHGSSVHFVTEELDGGPLIAQSKTKIAKNETEESLIKKILKLEHQLYPQVAKWFLNGQIKLENNEVLFENKKLEQVIQL